MLVFNLYNRTKQEVGESLFLPLLSQATRVLEREKIIKPGRTYRLELTMIGEPAMQKLNYQYRNKNKPTDVLSLSFFDPKDTDGFIGELFICLPVAKKQASKLGHTLFEEIRFLFVHGLLHLFGFDHVKKKEEKKMMKFTEEILA